MSLLSPHRIEPQSGKPEALIVFLHGYGANGEDLLSLGHVWRKVLPQAVFSAPDAPQSVPFAGGGFQWFALSLGSRENYWRGANEAAPLLNKFLDEELAHYGLFDGQMVLVGFSQGTMMALHVGLRRKNSPAGIIGYSGALAGREHLRKELTHKPPVLLLHGAQDDVLPVTNYHETCEELLSAGIEVEGHVSRNLGHGINDAGVERGQKFLGRVLEKHT